MASNTSLILAWLAPASDWHVLADAAPKSIATNSNKSSPFTGPSWLQSPAHPPVEVVGVAVAPETVDVAVACGGVLVGVAVGAGGVNVAVGFATTGVWVGVAVGNVLLGGVGRQMPRPPRTWQLLLATGHSPM